MGKSSQTVLIEVFRTTVSMHALRDIKGYRQINDLDCLIVRFHVCLILPVTSSISAY